MLPTTTILICILKEPLHTSTRNQKACETRTSNTHEIPHVSCPQKEFLGQQTCPHGPTLR